MNFWQWGLFYFYSFAALIGLCAASSSGLLAHQGWYPTKERCADGTDREVSEEERIELAKRERMRARDIVIQSAQEVGDQMANSTTMAIVTGYNSGVAKIFQQQQALAESQPANQRGA